MTDEAPVTRAQLRAVLWAMCLAPPGRAKMLRDDHAAAIVRAIKALDLADRDAEKATDSSADPVVPFATARAVMARGLEDDGTYLAYHANVAVELQDRGVDHASSQRAAHAILSKLFDLQPHVGAAGPAMIVMKPAPIVAEDARACPECFGTGEGKRNGIMVGGFKLSPLDPGVREMRDPCRACHGTGRRAANKTDSVGVVAASDGGRSRANAHGGSPVAPGVPPFHPVTSSPRCGEAKDGDSHSFSPATGPAAPTGGAESRTRKPVGAGGESPPSSSTPAASPENESERCATEPSHANADALGSGIGSTQPAQARRGRSLSSASTRTVTASDTRGGPSGETEPAARTDPPPSNPPSTDTAAVEPSKGSKDSLDDPRSSHAAIVAEIDCALAKPACRPDGYNEWWWARLLRRAKDEIEKLADRDAEVDAVWKQRRGALNRAEAAEAEANRLRSELAELRDELDAAHGKQVSEVAMLTKEQEPAP